MVSLTQTRFMAYLPTPKSLWIYLFGLFFFVLLLFLVLIKISEPKPDSPSLPAKSISPISFLIFGDSGTGSPKQKELAKTMLNFPFDFILHTGDLAYPDGTTKQLDDNFFSIYKAHLARARFYPTPGNHDYLTQNLSPYLLRFDLPKQALRPIDNKRYYSFDAGNIHFIALDTNTSLNQVSDKYPDDMSDWLIADLKKSSHSTWKIIFFHHPPYSSGKQHGGDLRVRNILVPIFEKYGVDLVFSGHEHNYERTCQIKTDQCSSAGVVYIVTGGGGGSVYDFGQPQYFTASRSAQYHFVSASVSECEFSSQAINIEGKVIDTFSLDKCQ